ncbi:hypothetical protein G6F57_017451 [Rhizopus arrhizus]|nr:hypothetical protein G6F57_017451 [Rhizopus arrhizus]
MPGDLRARRQQFQAGRVHAGGLRQQRIGAVVKGRQHQEGHQRGAEKHQDCLDDLYPGRGGHAAEGHVDHHQRPDDQYRNVVVQPEQQHDQLARTDHLRDQVQRDDQQRRAGCQHPHGGLRQAERGHVREVVPAQVAQPFGDEEHDHWPAEQEADGVDHAVETADVDHARNPQERGGGKVIACDGQAVLKARQSAACRVEIRCGAGALGGPVGDAHGSCDEGQEHDDGGSAGLPGCGGAGRARQHAAQHEDRRCAHCLAFHETSLRMAASSGSMTVLEMCT